MEQLSLTAIVAVLAFALGIAASHATLGVKVAVVLQELKDLTRRVTLLENDAPIHFHRRASDIETA